MLLYLAAMVAVRVLVLAPGQHVDYEQRWSFGLMVMVPLASTVTYFLAIFSFGLAGDLADRRSIYPGRLFTIPVSDDALVRWPMLYGGAAMVALWIFTRQLALWPSGVEIPLFWPALFAVVILAWTQALTWMPYPKRGLRVIVTILWLACIGFTALFALHVGASEKAMLAILAPLGVLAYLVARVAISRARHGGRAGGRHVSAAPSPGWLGRGRLGRARSWIFTGLRDGSSPQGAQVWFEWRRSGRSLPVLVGLLLPFELSLFCAFNDTPSLVWGTLAAVLLTPPLLAVFVAATVNRSSSAGHDSYELTPFTATRPLTSASLILAKLLATVYSALAAWLLVLLAVPLGLWLSGSWPIVWDGLRSLTETVGRPRAIGLGLLGLAALVTSTWKLLVQSLFIGMSGRPWLVKATVFATLAGLTVLVPFAPWALENGRVAIAGLWKTLPWVLVTLVLCKMAAAAWIVARLAARRLITARGLIVGALCWDAAVLALYGLLVWLVPTLLVRESLLMMIAILAVPLARISAAPLALSWNRHR